VFAHIFNDMNQTVVPAALPFLIAQQHLSYASAATLVLTLTIASSVVQPVFGYITDKRSLPWLFPTGLLLALTGSGLIGFAPNFAALVACTLLTGIGVAAFHPEASRYANLVSGDRRATGMGFFGLGGNIGFASGPILVTPAVLAFGLKGTALVVIPGILYALYVGFFQVRRYAQFRKRARTARSRAERDDRWGAFGLLTTMIVLRSMAFFGIVTFTPLFFIGVLGTTKAQGNAALAMTLIAAALGTVSGGRLADRYDRRLVIAISCALGALLAAAIGVAAGAHAGIVAICVLFVVMAFCYQWGSTPPIVLGQEYLPTRIGTASGVTLGLAISIGGFGAPLLGHLADARGLIAVIFAIAGLALLAFFATLSLPAVRERTVEVRSANLQTTATTSS
ncbi:MAG: MFS transporter, partial [Candidatus Eremiobacteraeota bacterium]|nr:MFS transporter [Candidatus Eremiobacteraeota bacterium]